MNNQSLIRSLCIVAALLLNVIYGFYVQPISINFVSHPQSQIAVENSTVTFQCSINKTLLNYNLPYPDVIWFHNNSTSCPNATIEYHDSLIVSTCVIQSVQTANTGWYHCQVVDGCNTTFCQNLPCKKTVTSSRNAYLQIIGYTAFTSHQYLSSNESGTILKCFELHHSLLVTSYSLSDFDIVWTKDNKIIQNSTEVFKILPSKNLLVYSNSSTINKVIGTYQCQASLHNNSGKLITQEIELFPPLQHNPPALSLVPSFSSVYMSEINTIRSSLELVCLYNDISPLTINWTYNNSEQLTGEALWINSNLQSGNYCCTVGTISSCIYIQLLNFEPYTETLFIDTNSLTSHIYCITNSSLPVYWVHNGIPIAHTSSLTVTNSSGIYQCFIANSSLDAMVLYRILPFGWTNPISSVLPVPYPLPSTNFSLTWNLPQFTGGLDTIAMFVKVVAKYQESLFSPSTSSTQILSYAQVLTYHRDGYYEFKVTVTNSNGTEISETTTTQLDPCSVFSPLPPLITLTCDEHSALLNGSKSDLEPYPEYVDIYVHLQCFDNYTLKYSRLHQFLPHQKINVSVTQDIGENGFCNFTGFGSRTFCDGATTSSGICYPVTPVTPVVITTTVVISSTAVVISSTAVVISSTSAYPVVVSSTSSNTVVISLVNGIEGFSSEYQTTTISTINSLITNDTITSTVGATTTDSRLTDSVIVIMSILLTSVFVTTVLVVLCLIVLWKQNKARKSVIITPSSIITEGNTAIDLYFMSDGVAFGGDTDACSIVTQYNTPYWNEDTVSNDNIEATHERLEIQPNHSNSVPSEPVSQNIETSGSSSVGEHRSTSTSTIDSSRRISSDMSCASLDSGFTPDYLTNINYHSLKVNVVVDDTILEETEREVISPDQIFTKDTCALPPSCGETDSCHSYV